MSVRKRNAAYKPWLFAYCCFALAWITLLLYAGGFTTSIKAGMAFLDWPLSDGSVNPEGWLTETDKLAEHSHRLLGAKIGLLSIGLFIWTWLREERRWLSTLSRVLVLVVILQGVLGGARVRFDRLNLMTEHNLLAQSFAVAHACGAMVVLGILVAITLGCSRAWTEGRPDSTGSPPSHLRKLGVTACGLLFLQILVGAIMRHADAGLAIPRFPLASESSLLPAYWNFDVAIHFAHRAGALVVTAALLGFAVELWRRASQHRGFATGAVGLVLLLGLQIYLGALTIWTVKNPYVATLHHLGGAFLLASTWALTLLVHRPPIDDRPDTARARGPSHVPTS